MQREMDQLNRRIDQIDKQVSTILQLLTVNTGQAPSREPAVIQQNGGLVDSASTDKKIVIRAVQSPSFMDTITEQEEEMNSSAEANNDTQNGGIKAVKNV